MAFTLAKNIMEFLRNTDQDKLAYAAKAAILSLSTGLLAAFLLTTLFTFDAPADIGTESLFDVFSAVIFAPAAETLLMIPVFKVISHLTKRTDVTVIISVLFWAAFHSTFWIPWGIFVFLPFCVFSYAFINWQRISLRNAVITVTMIHAIHNLTSVTMSHLSE